MFYAIIAAAVVIAAVAIFFVAKRYNAIKKNGVEVDAVVSRIKEEENTDDDGHVNYTYTYYVRFTAQDGKSVEAKLNHAPRNTREGDTLRVKYLPEKPKYALLVK